MGCGFTLFVPAESPHNPDLAISALDLIEQLESLLTIYRTDSQISLVNRMAATQTVQVDECVFRLLSIARKLWTRTEGAFDITAGSLAQLWGFSAAIGRPQIPDPQVLVSALSGLGCDKLLLDENDRSVRFANAGPIINLGGIGKGFALDECKLLLDRLAQDGNGFHNYMIHGGLSSILARGKNGQEPWRVDLRWPSGHRPWSAQLPLTDLAMATSADTAQHFELDGQRFGHIIDPRNGRPATGIEMVTVIAQTAAEADALSTAFYVMGVDATVAYCQAHPAVAAILVTKTETAEPVIHAVGPLPTALEWNDDYLRQDHRT